MLSHDIHSKNIMKIIWYNNYLMKNNCINMGISILPLNGKLQLSVDKNALKRGFNEIKYRNKYGWHLRNYSWPVSLNDDFFVWKSQPHWCCWNCVFCFVMMHHFHVYGFFFDYSQRFLNYLVFQPLTLGTPDDVYTRNTSCDLKREGLSGPKIAILRY